MRCWLTTVSTRWNRRTLEPGEKSAPAFSHPSPSAAVGCAEGHGHPSGEQHRRRDASHPGAVGSHRSGVCGGEHFSRRLLTVCGQLKKQLTLPASDKDYVLERSFKCVAGCALGCSLTRMAGRFCTLTTRTVGARAPRAPPRRFGPPPCAWCRRKEQLRSSHTHQVVRDAETMGRAARRSQRPDEVRRVSRQPHYDQTQRWRNAGRTSFSIGRRG